MAKTKVSVLGIDFLDIFIIIKFYNQKEKEVGNYPIATVYANMHLKQTRFFVMFYNVGTKVFKKNEYFSLPNYPVNPFMLKMGLSVDLHN